MHRDAPGDMSITISGIKSISLIRQDSASCKKCVRYQMFSNLKIEEHTSVPTEPVGFTHLHRCLRTVLQVMFVFGS